MIERTVEDRLREEYFDLLPDVRRVGDFLEAEVRYAVLPIRMELAKYENLSIVSRIKTCDSAVDALRRRQEGATFDPDHADQYSLTALNDLAGVRVMAFPKMRRRQVDQVLRDRFLDWTFDPVPGEEDASDPLALKYHGLCRASTKVRGEYQIVSTLIGLFWEVEHSAIYKLSPELRGITREPEMQRRVGDVYKAMRAFEATFERLIQD